MPGLSCQITDDLWRCVFEELWLILGDRGQKLSGKVAPLLLVCKQWKALAEPFFYRCLQFKTLISIEKCHEQLLTRFIKGDHPGRAARELILEGVFSGPPIIGAPTFSLERFLPYLPNLRTFRTDRFNCRLNHIEMLAHTCGDTLQKLDLDIYATQERGSCALQLVLLRRFAQLTELTLRLQWHNTRSPSTQTEAPCLSGLTDMNNSEYTYSMPCLQYLNLDSTPSVPHLDRQIIAFIANGRYPDLKELSLTLSHQDAEAPNDMCSEELLSLFRNIGSTLNFLQIRLPETELACRLFFSLLPKLNGLVPLGGLGPRGLLTYLPPSVKTVWLGCNLQLREQTEALVQRLEELSSSDVNDIKLTTVQLWVASGARAFDWDIISSINPALSGLLMTQSFRLASRNIRVKDAGGTWIGRVCEEPEP